MGAVTDPNVLQPYRPQPLPAPPPKGADGDLLAVDPREQVRGLGQRDQPLVGGDLPAIAAPSP